MILIVPAIEIKSGKCVQIIRGIDGMFNNDDPVEIAKLWRKENAKSLHVTDIDGAISGHLVNFDVIQRIVKAVDIPIELGGGLRSLPDVKKAFKAGIYRVVVGTMLIDNPDEAGYTVSAFGPNRVVLGIDAKRGIVKTKGFKVNSGLTALSVALNAKQLGFKRVIYTDLLTDGVTRVLNFEAIKMLVEKSGLRVTPSGGLQGLEDLLKLQEMEHDGIDSVIIGRALYENKFSCQGLWRLCESRNYPYTAKV